MGSEADIHKVFHDVYPKSVSGIKYWKDARQRLDQLEEQYPEYYQALHKDSEFYDVTEIGNKFRTFPQWIRTYFNRFRNCEQITDASCEDYKTTPWDALTFIEREDWKDKAKEDKAKRATEKTPTQTEAAAKRAQSDAEAPQTEAENAKAKEMKKEVRAEEKREEKHEKAAAHAGAKAAGDANMNMAVLSIVFRLLWRWLVIMFCCDEWMQIINEKIINLSSLYYQMACILFNIILLYYECSIV